MGRVWQSEVEKKKKKKKVLSRFSKTGWGGATRRQSGTAKLQREHSTFCFISEKEEEVETLRKEKDKEKKKKKG